MELAILVDGEGFSDVEEILIDDTAPLLRIVEVVASRTGENAAEFSVFIENLETPCDTNQPVLPAHHRHVHHVHRHKSIEVVVTYAGERFERAFPPSTTVKRVLDWAIGPHAFRIDPSYAAEMQLAIVGTEKALPDMAHIGRFVKGHSHVLELTLIRGVIPNG